MSKSERIEALKQEVSRLQKAKQSNLARHIDVANLLDARDKLRALEQEVRITISDNKQILS